LWRQVAGSPVDEECYEHWVLRGRVGLRTDAVVMRLLRDPREAKSIYAAVWHQQACAGSISFKMQGKAGFARAGTWNEADLSGGRRRSGKGLPWDPKVKEF